MTSHDESVAVVMACAIDRCACVKRSTALFVACGGGYCNYNLLVRSI